MLFFKKTFNLKHPLQSQWAEKQATRTTQQTSPGRRSPMKGFGLRAPFKPPGESNVPLSELATDLVKFMNKSTSM